MREIGRPFFVICDGSEAFRVKMKEYMDTFHRVNSFGCTNTGGYYGKSEYGSYVYYTPREIHPYRHLIISFETFLGWTEDVKDTLAIAVKRDGTHPKWNEFISLANEYIPGSKWVGDNGTHWYTIMKGQRQCITDNSLNGLDVWKVSVDVAIDLIRKKMSGALNAPESLNNSTNQLLNNSHYGKFKVQTTPLTIRRAEKRTGHPVQGKRSRVSIKLGHLSHRTVTF